ncbi:MAG: PEP-utilizing protein, partial [Chloroflexota bacterium]
MPLKEEVLGQFLGDESFPVEWVSETEKDLFWVYDDLHCPKPLSPMYEDIGGWWLSCDHMFRRFGTPFASDWIYKNINGYLYTAAIPAEAGVDVATQEYNYTTHPIVPEDNAYAGKIGAYLGTVLPVYGLKFTDWWKSRFVPEMQRNFDYIEGMLDQKDQLSLAEVAVLLEDAIDMHDRHWKIHWMLNFAQLSATLNLRAVMEKTHGKVDEALLGRLQNSANDRNWDKIKALWEAKEEVKADADLAAIFAATSGAEILPALKASARGQRFIDERIVPYQKEFGWHAVWSHEFIFPSFREDMVPVVQLVRDQFASDYDYPTRIATLAADIAAAAKEILAGLEGEALEEMRAANEINLKMAPLTPDHHFYIDQGANAHVRLVLVAVGEKLVAQGVLDAPDDVILFRYNDLRAFIGNPGSMDGRAIVAAAKA